MSVSAAHAQHSNALFIVGSTTYKHGAHHEQLLIGVVLVNKMDLQGEPETVHGVLYCMYKRRMSE